MQNLLNDESQVHRTISVVVLLISEKFYRSIMYALQERKLELQELILIFICQRKTCLMTCLVDFREVLQKYHVRPAGEEAGAAEGGSVQHAVPG